jgi:truncated hemoglobin YjbI
MTAAPAADAFQESLARASAHPAFLDRFYARFMAASPAIGEIFAGRDMDRLKRKLRSSLHVMTLAAEQAPGVGLYIDHLASLHQRFAIPPAMYALWLDALVATAAECDPEFDATLGAAWRAALAPGVARIGAPPA